ncbi:MAG: DNA alkylation repair protein [Fimbriimonadaceae bacterium]|nr:DNA alkylation repair protein [Fimbriimonadaceae bacterium]
MTKEEVMDELKSKRDESVYRRNERSGVGDKQFGVKLGEIRKTASKIKTDTALGKELWATGNLDAMLLASLIFDPKDLSLDDLERMLKDVPNMQLAEWFGPYVVKAHPEKDQRREKWMNSDHVMVARMGWSLTASRVAKNPEGLDLPGLLDRIESEMGDAPYDKAWTMNYTLAEIGINFPEHRDRAMTIGEKIGAFRDYPVSKGCTSPFAPIWITEMVKRQSK